jgi:hypothetical protein
VPNQRQLPYWDRIELEQALVGAQSVAHVLRNLGVPARGASYASIRSAAAEFGLELPATPKPNPPGTRALCEILVEGSTYTDSSYLKKRLIVAGLLEEVCVKCTQGPRWMNEPLVLTLDHINGIPDDNRLENLRLLCPNCHSQTPTFGGRNKRVGRRKPKCASRSRLPRAELHRTIEVLGNAGPKPVWADVARQLGVAPAVARRRVRTVRAFERGELCPSDCDLRCLPDGSD